jgi:hypothetical protein
MATNQYFNHYTATNEQALVENTIIEMIKIKGFDVKYIPRAYTNQDYLTGDSIDENYTNAFDIEMYLESVDSFGGDTMLMSKFGLNIEDSATLVVSKKRFAEEIANNDIDLEYPLMGDLLYMPMSKSLLEIEHVETEEPFYQLGKNYVYKLKVHLFTYTHQDFNTGVADVDNFVVGIDLNGDDDLTKDVFGDNVENTVEAKEFIDLSVDNPFINFDPLKTP